MSLSEYSNNSNKLCDTIREEDNGEKAQLLVLNNANDHLNHKSSQDTLLHSAITNFKDIETVEILLDQGADIHALNQSCQTPLDVAIEINHEEAVKLLLKKEAHLGRNFNLLICNAIKKANDIIVKILVDHGLQNNLLMNPRKCLDVAIEEGHLKIIDYIIPYCELKKLSDRQFSKNVVSKNGQQYRDCINLLFKHGFVVSPRYKKSCDFVYPAVENGHILIVKEILKFGTDINMINQKTKLSLLHVAVLYQRLDIAELLIHHKADVNAIIANRKWLQKDQQLFGKITKLGGKTALHIAVDNADLKITKLLLDNGAKIKEDPTFFNIASDAVRKGCKNILEIFLEYGVHVNDADACGRTLLHHCTMYNSQTSDNNPGCEIAAFLLKKGADINAQTQEGNTPIFDAIVNGNIKIFKLFLHNVNIQHRNTHGDTLLHKAFETVIDPEIIEILLKYNAEVNAANKKGWTSLHVACQNGLEKDLKIIKKLLDYKADINCVNENKRTPLHLACDKGCAPIVELLLEHHAAVNLADEDGNTALHLAFKKRNVEIIENLLKNEADPNVKDKDGKTPLIIACEGLSGVIPGIMEYFLETQADIESLKSAIDAYDRNSRPVQLLLEYKADVHVVNNEGKSPLHIVAEKNYLNIAKILFKCNIDVNIVDKKGEAALHYAAAYGHLAMVKSLLIQGADVDILCNSNKTSLHYASIGITRVRRALRNYLKDPEKNFYGRPVPADYEDEHTKSYKNEIITVNEIIKTLKEHIIKLECAKLNVNQKSILMAYVDDDEDGSAPKFDPSTFRCKCEKEIAQLKLQDIEGNNSTFYDLLTKNTHYLARYDNNKSILKSLLSAEHRQMFPLYIDIIIVRFVKGAQRHNLLEVAKKYSLPTIFQRLSSNHVDEIFSYLSNNELKIFINTIKTIIDCDKSKSSGAQSFINKCAIIFDNQPNKKRKIS